MELILLAAVILGFIFNILLMKSFFTQLANKLHTSSAQPMQKQQVTVTKQAPSLPKFPWQAKVNSLIDTPSPNTVMDEDQNEVEFDENTPLPGVPPTVKLDVEGGDSFVPPGFEEATI